MATVSRKDKLRGSGEIASGVIKLVIAIDPSDDPALRRMTAGLGATSIVSGAGRARGRGRVHEVGTWAGVAVVAGVSIGTLGQLREASEPVDAGRGAKPGAPITRRERLKAVSDMVSSVISLAIATDPSLERPERFWTGVMGVAGLIGGVGKLRRQESALVVAGLGYGLALSTAGVTGVRRRRRLRRQRWWHRRALGAGWKS